MSAENRFREKKKQSVINNNYKTSSWVLNFKNDMNWWVSTYFSEYASWTLTYFIEYMSWIPAYVKNTFYNNAIYSAAIKNKCTQVRVKFWGFLFQTFVLQSVIMHINNARIEKRRGARLSNEKRAFWSKKVPIIVRFFIIIVCSLLHNLKTNILIKKKVNK